MDWCQSQLATNTTFANWNNSYFSLFTMLGNLVVLQTFVQNEKLRTMNNLYIMNLAIADFLIGMAKGPNWNQPSSGRFSPILGLFWPNSESEPQTSVSNLWWDWFPIWGKFQWISLQFIWFMENGFLGNIYVMKRVEKILHLSRLLLTSFTLTHGPWPSTFDLAWNVNNLDK